MKILSIETTSEIASIAFLEDSEIISEYSFKNPDIAGILLSRVDGILKNNHCGAEDLGLIVVSRGPGLWTGIRLGMGVAKGLAVSFKTRIYCVGTAESIFFAIKELEVASACIVNAYRERIHFSYFNGSFNYKRSYPIKTISCNELYDICMGKEIILTGPGISVLPGRIKNLKTVTILPEQMLYPRAWTNALLSLEKIERKVPSLPLEPFYGR